jgi:signal transduction histidine kinase
MEEVRNISQSLHPRMAEDLGLVSALEALGRRAEERGRLRVSVVTELDERPISANVAATLFRVAQEALNAAELTQAHSADVLVYSNGGTVCLEVRDDRPLVDTAAVPVDNSTNGLSSIMDRVELSGGVMRIERGPNGGMRVAAELDSTESGS